MSPILMWILRELEVKAKRKSELRSQEESWIALMQPAHILVRRLLMP